MDETLISEKERGGDKVPENDTSRKVQPGDVEMEETKRDSLLVIEQNNTLLCLQLSA